MTTTPVQQQPQTIEDYAKRTALAAEKLAKIAVGWTVVAVIVLVVGFLAYMQATHGPVTTP